MRDTSNTVQSNYAQVQVGDYLRTQEIAGMIETANPNHDKGRPRRVSGKDKVKGVGTTLHFSDGSVSVTRSGTASVYKYKLDADGKPIPDPLYPTCPHCGAEPDDPSCYAASGDRVGGWHAKRQAATPPTPPKRKADLLTAAKDSGRLEIHHVTAPTPPPTPPARPADTVDGSYASVMQDGASRRVTKDADGTVRISDWTHGAHVYETPEGWLVHVDEAGVVTVLEGKPTPKGKPTDNDPGEHPIVVPGNRPGRIPEHLAVHDDDPEADGDPDAPVAPTVERCGPCKGYGLVRKAGSQAGKHYRTMNGALQAEANGNAVPCPHCNTKENAA